MTDKTHPEDTTDFGSCQVKLLCRACFCETRCRGWRFWPFRPKGRGSEKARRASSLGRNFLMRCAILKSACVWQPLGETTFVCAVRVVISMDGTTKSRSSSPTSDSEASCLTKWRTRSGFSLRVRDRFDGTDSVIVLCQSFSHDTGRNGEGVEDPIAPQCPEMRCKSTTRLSPNKGRQSTLLCSISLLYDEDRIEESRKRCRRRY